MEISKGTRVSDILTEYGNIAEVMGAFGVKRIGRYSVRRIITKHSRLRTLPEFTTCRWVNSWKQHNKPIGSGDTLPTAL